PPGRGRCPAVEAATPPPESAPSARRPPARRSRARPPATPGPRPSGRDRALRSAPPAWAAVRARCPPPSACASFSSLNLDLHAGRARTLALRQRDDQQPVVVRGLHL